MIRDRALRYRPVRRAVQVWLNQWLNGCMAVYGAGVSAVGIIGFQSPSLSMTNLIGSAYVIYAFGMTVLGVCIVAAVLTKSRRAEATLVVAVSGLTVIQGLIVFMVAGGGGQQTGLRLLITPLLAIPFAYLRAETLYTRRTIRQHIAALNDVVEVPPHEHG